MRVALVIPTSSTVRFCGVLGTASSKSVKRELKVKNDTIIIINYRVRGILTRDVKITTMHDEGLQICVYTV